MRSSLLPLLFALLPAALTPSARAQEDAPITSPPAVRVRLLSLGTPRQLTLHASGELQVTDSTSGETLPIDGESVTVTDAGGQLQLGEWRGTGLKVEADEIDLEGMRPQRAYPGALVLTASRGGISLMNECSLESYTAGVLAGECPALFQPEAIKAMAVAARTYSYRRAFLSRTELCDGTHCQLYRGLGGIRQSIRDAVEATSGLLALYDGEPIDAVYCSDCGGYTEANEEAWKGAKPLPYLRPVEDAPEPHGEPYCAVNRSHEWTLALSRARLQSLIGKTLSTLKLEATQLTESGRVRRLQLAPDAAETGSEGAASSAAICRLFTGEQWRRLLGMSALKSLKFEIRETEDGVLLRGAGWGHGVGLCQFGANGMAKQGATFEEILKHYYTGITVGPSATVMRVPPAAADAKIARSGARRTAPQGSS